MTMSLASQIAGVAKLQLAFVGLGFASQIVLARYLGPEGKGMLDLFLLIPVFLSSALDFGLLPANTFFTGKRLYPAHVLHLNSLAWSILTGFVVLTAGWLVLPFATGLIQNISPDMLLLAIGLLTPTLYFSLWSALMYGTNRTRTVYQVNALSALVMLVLYILLVFAFRAGVMSFLLVSCGVLVARSVLAFSLFHSPSVQAVRLDLGALKASFRYGIALYVGLAVNALHFRIDQFLVNSLLGSAHLGWYALAVRIAELVWILDYAVINATIFRITASSPEEATRTTQRMTRLIGTMVLSACVIVAASSPIVIPLVFGDDFTPSVLPLALLMPGILAWSLSRALSQFIAYQKGKPWENTKAAAAAFVVNVALNFLLIPMWGIAGASVASSISYVLNLLFISRVFKKLSGSELLPCLIPTREDFALAKQLLHEHLSLRRREDG